MLFRSCVFDFFKDFLYRDFLALFELANFCHHIFQHIANEHFGVLVTLHALVNFNFDHFANLVSHLKLLAAESIDLIANTVGHLGKLSSDVHFLLGTGKFLLA